MMNRQTASAVVMSMLPAWARAAGGAQELARGPRLRQEHLYRRGVVARTMGHYYPTQLGQ